jgi:hypothetical protein
MEPLDLSKYRTVGVIADLHWNGVTREQILEALGAWDIALDLAVTMEKRFMLASGARSERWPLAGACDKEEEVYAALQIMHTSLGKRYPQKEGLMTPWILLVSPEFRERLLALLDAVRIQ